MKNSIPSADRLPPKSLDDDTQDDEMPEGDQHELHKPPARLGAGRVSAKGATEADPETGSVDVGGHIPAPQLSNRD